MLTFGKTSIGVGIALIAYSCVSVAYAQGDYVSYGDSMYMNFSASPLPNAMANFVSFDDPGLVVADFSPSPVPEPSSILLSCFALAIIAGGRTVTRHAQKFMNHDRSNLLDGKN